MGRKSNQTVGVVTINPEAIPVAKERFTELLYHKYIEYLDEHNLTEIKDPRNMQSKK